MAGSPKLWDAVRTAVDSGQKKGMFILTDSSTPVRKGILHSGTGRMATLRMHTMSLYESGDSIGTAIQLPDGRWGAFEIKLGMNQVDEAAEKLIAFTEKIRSDGGRVPEFLCVIVGLSSYAYRREDGVYVVPITALRDRRAS